MVERQANGYHTNGSANDGSVRYVPRGASGIGVHDYVPILGYREYWYPAVEDKKIRRKPVALTLLGEQIVFFRDTNNQVAALADACPHRGAFLSGGVGAGKGNGEYKGYITCPYHGYTFDGTGQCVAAFTDGPDSKLQPKLKARHYPTRTHRGLVFIWMGVTEPVPLEEDLPEEFFEEDVTWDVYVKIWPINWSLTMENSRDSHNGKIHRGSWRRLWNLQLFNKLPSFWEGTDITEEGDNYICIAPRVRGTTYQAMFPQMGKKWPQHVWWRFKGGRQADPLAEQKKAFNNTRPGGLYRLPAIANAGPRAQTASWRYFTPIDANSTRMFKFGLKRTKHWWEKVWHKVYYNTLWIYFGAPQAVNEQEDLPVQAFGALDYTAPQKLGATDAAIIFWRRHMPFKSRDAQRIWGKERIDTANKDIAQAQEQEAIEVPLD